MVIYHNYKASPSGEKRLSDRNNAGYTIIFNLKQSVLFDEWECRLWDDSLRLI